jgi:4-hydroxy-tetrahydrodipicolinate synthase
MGGHGTANVTGNVAPREMAQLSKPWRSWDDVVKGRALYFKYLPLMEAAYSATNPVAIKAMVKLMGLPSGDPRPPLPKIEGDKLKPLEEVIRRFKLREKYGRKVASSLEKGEKNFPDVLTQTVCDIKKDT